MISLPWVVHHYHHSGEHKTPYPHMPLSPASAPPYCASLHYQQYPYQQQPDAPPPIVDALPSVVIYQSQQPPQYSSNPIHIPPPGYVSYPQPQYAPRYTQPRGSVQPGYVTDQQERNWQNPSQYHSYGNTKSPKVLGPGRPGMPIKFLGGPPYIEPYISGTALGDESAAIGAPERNGSTAALLKGPARKPKQSEHALWVGSLPPNATIYALRDHFSRDFLNDIESLFHISRSNCAFVNYRSEEASTRAMQKFHTAWFEGFRLVCRLQNVSTATPTPTSLSGTTCDGSSQAPSLTSCMQSKTDNPGKSQESKGSDKFFIIKSLTVQDLEQSVRNGLWATQSHNKKALNNAYDVSPSNRLFYP